MLGGSYYFLELTALGRQEDWEEPKDLWRTHTARCRTSPEVRDGRRALFAATL
jgi:hypothetical protein